MNNHKIVKEEEENNISNSENNSNKGVKICDNMIDIDKLKECITPPSELYDDRERNNSKLIF